MSDMLKILKLHEFTDDDLKAELSRRRVVERAKRYVTSAEEALKRAKAKYELYVATIKQETELAERKQNSQHADKIRHRASRHS